jgi:uncharacterized membrane protein
MKPRLLYTVCWVIAWGYFFSETLALKGEPGLSASNLPAKARTILKQHCFQCHGEDPENMEGDGLAILDYGMLVERRLIVAGQAGKSRLIKKVELGTMPPPGEGTPVPPEEIKVLRAWIDGGALRFPGESGHR